MCQRDEAIPCSQLPRPRAPKRARRLPPSAPTQLCSKEYKEASFLDTYEWRESAELQKGSGKNPPTHMLTDIISC